MSYLKISHLYKSYGTDRVLRDISLEVKAGEFVSFLGPSGCGKTTLLRCIAGLEMPDKDTDGKISISDQELSSDDVFIKPEERNLGMVFQSYAVWPHMDVFDNVAFPLRTKKRFKELSKADVKKIVFDSLTLVKLRGLEKRFGHELSGGQQQRVALARAIAMSPQVLLLDEPLSNLDVLLREELRAEIQRLQKHLKITTILVTHDQREALSLSDRVFLLKAGHIEAHGTPQELYNNPPTPFVAEFLAGGQSLKDKAGVMQNLIPRFWRKSDSGLPFKIVSRLYLGSEYEYWAESNEFLAPIKFYSNDLFENGATIELEYKSKKSKAL